jgi:capsular polysaccharide transport system permease protein
MIRRSQGTVLSQLLLQVRIVTAVARREMQLRAAKGLFGVAGVFLEPLALIGTFLALRILLRGAGEDVYINIVLWLALGFIPFFMFADIAIKAISGVQKGGDLYFYRRLRPLDSLMGNALLISQIFGIMLLVFVVGVAAWEWRPVLSDPGSAIFLFVGISLLGFGIGLSTLIIGHRVPPLAWIIKTVLRRILLWTSCIFFPIRIIPDEFRPWILWNPIAHGVELLRQSFNPAYPIPGVSATYFWMWVVGSIGFGLFIYGNNEELLYSTDQLPGADQLGLGDEA